MFDQIDFLFYADNELRVADFFHGVSVPSRCTSDPAAGGPGDERSAGDHAVQD